MNATNPIEINGKSYDKFSLNLAISGRYLGDGSSDANVAMRLVPTSVNIENGEVITADEAAIGIALGSLAGSDAATQQAVGAIQAALQSYILAKGL
jgi:hypothetical protein